MTLTKVIIHNKERWRLEYRANGKRMRPTFATRSAAEAELTAIKERKRKAGESFVAMNPSERGDLISIAAEIIASGKTLRDVWDNFKKGSPQNVKPSPTLEDSIADLIKSKRSAGCRETYLSNLKQMLAAFARGREKMSIASVTQSDIESWLTANRKTRMARLSTLFGFAVRRGWISENLCRRLERIREDQKPPQILTHRQILKAIAFTHRRDTDFLAWLILGLFAGLRPEEADSLSWAQVDTKARTVRVESEFSKVRQRRIVHLMPAAAAWLKEAKSVDARLPIPKVTRRRYLRRLRKIVGFAAWPKDVLRHTCASHWLAQVQDAAKIALELGNSVGVLLRHYRELVTMKEAKRFWAITPKKTKKEKA